MTLAVSSSSLSERTLLTGIRGLLLIVILSSIIVHTTPVCTEPSLLSRTTTLLTSHMYYLLLDLITLLHPDLKFSLLMTPMFPLSQSFTIP